MVARLVSIGKRAVVLSIIVGRQGIERVVARVSRLIAILGPWSEWLLDGKWWEKFGILFDLWLRR